MTERNSHTTEGQAETAGGLPGRLAPVRHRRYDYWRWRIFSITWLAYAGSYLTRKAFSVAKNEWKKPEGMGMTKADMSWIDGANSVAYAAGQFIWGPLGDKFGPRVIVLVGMLALVTTALAMGYSSSVLLMGVLFAIQGLCQSSGWAPLTKNVGEFVSRRERGSVMGFWCTNYALGGFVASTLAAWAAQKFGWRHAFFLPAGTLFIIWILFLLFQRNRPKDVGLPPIEQYHGEAEEVIDPKATPALEPEGSWKIVVEVIRNKMVWLLAGVYFLNKPTRYLMLFWSPVYINGLLGTGTATSGFLGSLFDLAGPIGSLTGDLISNRLFKSKRVPVCVITLLGLALLMVTFRSLPATRLGWAPAGLRMAFLSSSPTPSSRARRPWISGPRKALPPPAASSMGSVPWARSLALRCLVGQRNCSVRGMTFGIRSSCGWGWHSRWPACSWPRNGIACRLRHRRNPEAPRRRGGTRK